jgi:hypothetical protein
VTDPTTLTRRFAVLTALRWLPAGLFMPVGVLLFLARGVDVPTVGVLFTVHSAVVMALELPTGGLADALGRRTVLAVSGGMHAASAAVLAVGHDVPTLAVGALLMGVGRALGSGPLDAWYVDAALAHDPDADLTHGLARGHTGEALGLGVGAVLGGLLPHALPFLPSAGDAPVLRLSAPLLLGTAVALVYLAGVLRYVRDPGTAARARVRDVVAEVPAAVRSGLALGLRDGVLRRLLARTALVGAAIAALEVLAPVRVAGLLGGREAGASAYGVLVTVGFFAVAGGTSLAPTLVRLLRSGRRTVALTTVAGAGAVAALASPAIAAVAVAYVLFYAMLGGAGPVAAALLHGRVTSRERATVLSVESLVQQGGGTVATLTLPALAAGAGYGAAFGVAGAAAAAGAVVLLGMRADVGAAAVVVTEETTVAATRA